MEKGYVSKFEQLAKLFKFPVVFLTETELEEEIKQTKKQYDEIEEWFKKHGEAASNLKFFQEDAKSTFLKIKLNKLKAANNDIMILFVIKRNYNEKI